MRKSTFAIAVTFFVCTLRDINISVNQQLTPGREATRKEGGSKKCRGI
jgi:VanZ family protein